jgi:F-type H+-transporting ATPase subunit alpha
VPLAVEKQVVLVYAGTQGYADKLPVDSLRQYEEELYRYIDEKHADLWESIRTKREITDDIKGTLDKALKAFGAKFVAAVEGKSKSKSKAASAEE